MNLLKCLYPLIIMVSLAGTRLVAQTWVVEYIGVEEGLASPDVWAIYQDQRALLWVGTEGGISRFDGFEFENFSHSAQGDRIGWVKTIVEDEEHRLWIGSDQGLFHWESGGFHRMEGIDQSINVLKFDRDQTLWLGCEEGLFYLTENEIFDLFTGKIVGPTTVPEQKTVLARDNRILSLAVTPDNHLLIGTHYFVGHYNGHQLTRLWGQADLKPDVQSIVAVGDSLYYWACDETTFYKYDHGKVSILDESLGLAQDLLYSEDKLWLLTFNNFYQFENESKQTILYEETAPEWFRKLVVDRDANFWIGTFEGLIKIKKTPFTHYDTSGQERVAEIYALGEDASGNLLCGGNRGMVWQRQTAGFKPYFQPGMTVVPQAEVFAIYPEENGALWMGTGYQGIALWQNGKLQNFTTAEGLADNSRYFFFRDAKGQLWTGGDGGVDQILRQENGAVSFNNYNYSTGNFSYVSFFAATEGPDHRLWLGSNHGLFVIDSTHLAQATIQSFAVANIHITDLAKDRDNNVWISTMGEGILKCRFNQKGQLELQQQFSVKEGLSVNTFLKLLLDREGHLWAGSYKGLCRLEIDSGEVSSMRFFDRKDGFLNASFSKMDLFQDRTGLIWCGTTEGIFSLDPELWHPNDRAPKVGIKRVELLDGQRSWQEYTTSVDDFWEMPQALSLPYSVNQLRFYFTGVSLKKPTDVQFRYRLLGAGEKWVYTRQDRRASYHQLRPGTYTFEVEAANEDGLWSEQPATFNFEIQPAFWQTWWFRFLLGFLLVFIAYRIYRHRRQLKEKKLYELQLQKEIAESKLTALQAQMNPHFVFNSLNSINWYIVKNRPREASQYLTKFSKLVRSILDNSKKPLVSLARELDALKLYLDLEAMRFEDKFTYYFQTDAELETEAILIPPLVLQPFVENAIWHGLMHKKDKGEIVIQIYPEGDCLKCIIQDNGIGRAAAAKIQASNQKKHQPKGLQLTSDRLWLLRQHHLKEEMIRVIDLEDENGMAAGTRVEILLPCE